MSTAEIRKAALQLSEDEKVHLAEEVLASLDGPGQAEVDAAWGAEAERRIEALDAGEKPFQPMKFSANSEIVDNDTRAWQSADGPT